MITGTVVRQRSGALGTPGRLSLANGFYCDTLEPPWHDNERGRSCTKADTYRGKAWYSPTLKRVVIRYEDKHGRKDCLVHNANFAAAGEEDIDGDGIPEVTQIHGCTAVGSGYGEIKRKDGKMQWGILASVKALERLIDALKCPLEDAETVLTVEGIEYGFKDVEITYKWAEGCSPEVSNVPA